MQKVRALKANLPTATQITSTTKPDIINLKVDRFGQVTADDKPVALSELPEMLAKRYEANTNVPVYITGSKNATQGSIIYVLDLVKRAGIQHVAISVKAAP